MPVYKRNKADAIRYTEKEFYYALSISPELTEQIDKLKEVEINGFAAAFYNAAEESEGQEYKTVTYMIDNGDEFVEVVFWLDGETAKAEVEAIINTLA